MIYTCYTNGMGGHPIANSYSFGFRSWNNHNRSILQNTKTERQPWASFHRLAHGNWRLFWVLPCYNDTAYTNDFLPCSVPRWIAERKRKPFRREESWRLPCKRVRLEYLTNEVSGCEQTDFLLICQGMLDTTKHIVCTCSFGQRSIRVARSPILQRQYWYPGGVGLCSNFWLSYRVLCWWFSSSSLSSMKPSSRLEKDATIISKLAVCLKRRNLCDLLSAKPSITIRGLYSTICV